MKPTLQQVLEFAQRDLEDQVKIPTPHEIALTFGAALLSSGKFAADDLTAAVETAWTLVIPYYAGRLAYERDVTTRAAIAGHVAGDMRYNRGVSVNVATDPEISPAEARAYVAGEAGPAGGAHVVASVDLTAVARQQRISEAAAKAIAAQAVLEEARHHLAAAEGMKRPDDEAAAAEHDQMLVRRREDVENAQADFDQAAAEQSKAYE